MARDAKAGEAMAAGGIAKSVTKSASLTLVTYTYNDNALAAGLLADAALWSVRPREIVVVDDGSAEPLRRRSG